MKKLKLISKYMSFFFYDLYYPILTTFSKCQLQEESCKRGLFIIMLENGPRAFDIQFSLLKMQEVKYENKEVASNESHSKDDENSVLNLDIYKRHRCQRATRTSAADTILG